MSEEIYKVKKLNIKIDEDKKITTIKNIKFFDLFKTLESGQTFRFKYIDELNKGKGVYVFDNSYTTLMTEKINKDNTTDLIICSIKKDEIEHVINFFNLYLDYEKINEEIIKKNKNMKSLINNSYGIRIIHSDLYESIITFIISQNNNMKRIKYSVDLLSSKYGKVILKDKKNNIIVNNIPDVHIVNKLSLDELRELKIGFRDKYIKDATEKIISKELDLDKLKKMNYNDSKIELMKVKGIGDKVASCIVLFGLNKFDSFPVDTWIEKYMLNNDLKNRKEKLNRLDIEEYGKKKYGVYAGIAQQYIFYYCITKMK